MKKLPLSNKFSKQLICLGLKVLQLGNIFATEQKSCSEETFLRGFKRVSQGKNFCPEEKFLPLGNYFSQRKLFCPMARLPENLKTAGWRKVREMKVQGEVGRSHLAPGSA